MGRQPASFAASQNRPTSEAEIADANPDGKSRSVPRAACAARRLHHSRIPGTPARQNCSPRWGSRRSRPRASALPIRSAASTVSLDAIIENCRMIADATDLPVNADLENCGADDPKTAAKAIARAAEAGCVGGSIEDSTGDPQQADLRFLARGRARAGGGRSGARAALPVHADGARGEFPARPQRSRRHHQAAAGVRGRWRRRAVFARPV